MKYNKTTTTKTENLAGGEALKVDEKYELVSILLTSFVKDQFYRSENLTTKSVEKLIAQIGDKLFVAKAAVFARTKYGMRSISHLIASDIAKTVKGEKWTKNFFDKVVHRVDDMLEILALYFGKNGKPMPNSMKKGFREAMGRFDEYQLAKYRGDGKAVSLVDLVNLIHPKPTDKNAEAIKKLVADELKQKKTWESKLSATGKADTEEKKAELKKEAWADLIKNKSIGYFALLRNLRNIIEQSPEVTMAACSLLTDENLIKKSLVLPFRFITAQEQIEEMHGSKEAREVIQAINSAIEISLQNVPKFDGDTLVVLDTSGSMEGQPAKIGSLFAAVLTKTNNADFMMFSDDAQYKNLNLGDSVATIAKGMRFQCGGTNFHAIFQEANKKYDRIIILSDMQGWVGYDSPVRTFNGYKIKYGANPHIFSFDLQGYGTLQFPQSQVYCLAGFSERVFDIMKLLEVDRQALINEIDKIEL